MTKNVAQGGNRSSGVSRPSGHARALSTASSENAQDTPAENAQETPAENAQDIPAENAQDTSAEDISESVPGEAVTICNDCRKRQENEQAPDNYIKRHEDWFDPGRYFKVWAPRDQEIHERHFILLDSRNKEGPGVRVDVLESIKQLEELKGESSTSMSRMVLKCCQSEHGSNNAVQHAHEEARKEYIQNQAHRDLLDLLDRRYRGIHMDKHTEHFVRPGSYIRLDHTYNIPFNCLYEDMGMIDDDELETLRVAYIEYVSRRWRLKKRVKILDHGST